jgi:hypothetical protein
MNAEFNKIKDEFINSVERNNHAAEIYHPASYYAGMDKGFDAAVNLCQDEINRWFNEHQKVLDVKNDLIKDLKVAEAKIKDLEADLYLLKCKYAEIEGFLDEEQEDNQLLRETVAQLTNN